MIILYVLTIISFSNKAQGYFAENNEKAAGKDQTDDTVIDVCFPEWVDVSRLESDFISRVMPHKTRLRASRPSGYSLTGSNLKLYTALKDRIHQVAAGEESSTYFSLSAEDIFDQTAFSAEDLGVDALGYEEDGEFAFYVRTTQAFTAKLSEMLDGIDFPTVLSCVMADNPYDLYWFNKSYIAPTNTFDKQITDDFSKVQIIGEYQFALMVSTDYALGSVSDDGEWIYDRTAVDPSYGQSVSRAAENATLILSANQDKSDYRKLCAYRDAICELADYNHDVNKETPYGDPWQLVWVFDGKPNTKVVCEGYAKAFQYLAEQGTTEATVISVQGRIPAGAHMWNIATIGHHHYLVDLTNYDLGYDLFLKGSEDGNPGSGYTICHRYGTLKYVYDEATPWSEADLTLSQWDYEMGDADMTPPDGLTEIQNEAFHGIAAEIVALPEILETIGDYAFAQSEGLRQVYIPESVTEIGAHAFNGCSDELVIFGKAGSEAERFAAAKGMEFRER